MQTKNHSKSVKQLFMTRFSPLRTPNVSNRMNESFQKYVCARSFFRLFLERFFSCSICFVFQLKISSDSACDKNFSFGLFFFQLRHVRKALKENYGASARLRLEKYKLNYVNISFFGVQRQDDRHWAAEFCRAHFCLLPVFGDDGFREVGLKLSISVSGWSAIDSACG